MATFDDPLIEVVGDDPKHIARAMNVMHVSTCHGNCILASLLQGEPTADM